jgi:hypothetical protein
MEIPRSNWRRVHGRFKSHKRHDGRFDAFPSKHLHDRKEQRFINLSSLSRKGSGIAPSNADMAKPAVSSTIPRLDD